jgi:hypothetical protein
MRQQHPRGWTLQAREERRRARRRAPGLVRQWQTSRPRRPRSSRTLEHGAAARERKDVQEHLDRAVTGAPVVPTARVVHVDGTLEVADRRALSTRETLVLSNGIDSAQTAHNRVAIPSETMAPHACAASGRGGLPFAKPSKRALGRANVLTEVEQQARAIETRHVLITFPDRDDAPKPTSLQPGTWLGEAHDSRSTATLLTQSEAQLEPTSDESAAPSASRRGRTESATPESARDAAECTSGTGREGR